MLFYVVIIWCHGKFVPVLERPMFHDCGLPFMKQPLLSHDGNVYGFIPSNYNRIDLFYNNQALTCKQLVIYLFEAE